MEECLELNSEVQNSENGEMVNAFLRNLKEKNRSKETIMRHRGILQRFFLRYTETFTTISEGGIQQWITEQQEGRTERTVNDYLISLRSFYTFCVLEKHIETSPFQDKKNAVSSPERYWELKVLVQNQENQRGINQFLGSLKKAEGNIKTIVCKRVFLQNFFKGYEKPFYSSTLKDINEWMTENHDAWSKETIRGIRSTLRTFYDYCWEEGIMENPPLRNKRKVKDFPERYWEVQIRLGNEETKKVINEYLVYLKKKNRSQRTVEDYRGFLQLFFKDNTMHFSQVKTTDIQQWFNIHKKECKDTTIVDYTSILRSFYAFCFRKAYVTQSPIHYKWEKEHATENYWELRKPFINQENKEVINDYLLSMRLANRSAGTIYQYKFFLEKFFKDRQETFSTLSSDEIMKWLIHHQKNLKESTIRYRLTILSSFYNFCIDESYLEKSPIKRRWYPRLPKPVPRYLEKEEIAKICQATEKGELRDRVLLEFLLTTGCRIGEVHKLDKREVDLENRTAVVTGKGNKIREVHFTEKCAMILERYLETCEDDHPALFVSERGTRLSIRRKQEIIEGIGKDVKLAGSLYPHRLRHTFATEMLIKGADLSFIADELGHENLQTTKIYASLPKWKLISLYRMYMG